MTTRPPLVEAARAGAGRLGFAHSCTDETGRLLAAVAEAVSGSRAGARAAEIGTGAGVGAAWLLAGLGTGAHLTTVEVDPVRAAAATETLAVDARATVIAGDWRVLASLAPFDLVFCDGGGKHTAVDDVVALVRPGGVLLLDDFSPPAGRRPPLFEGRPDLERLAYLDHPRLHAVEVLVSAHEVAVVAVAADPALLAEHRRGLPLRGSATTARDGTDPHS